MNNSNLLTLEAGSEATTFLEEEYGIQLDSSYLEKKQKDEVIVIRGTITVSP